MREHTGIDEQMIGRLVEGFYVRIREDTLLRPIFKARFTDWKPHLQRMCAFWSSTVLASGLCHGQPMRTHLPLPVDARNLIAGWRYSKPRRAICAQRTPPTTSGITPDGSLRASNSGSEQP